MREKNENDMKESEEEIRWSKEGLEKVMRDRENEKKSISLEAVNFRLFQIDVTNALNDQIDVLAELVKEIKELKKVIMNE